MTTRFCAELEPSKELCKEMTALVPTNPFYTSPYIESRRVLGFQPWVLLLQRDGQTISACTAFMKSGYLNRSLEIHSLPVIPKSESETFWGGLVQFCRKVQVSYLEVGSFASIDAVIPTLPGEIGRRTRWEYVLELKKPDLWDKLSSNHKRNIKRAQKAGLQLRCVRSEEACQQHARLMVTSMERRKNRGEEVSESVQTQNLLAITQHAAGELFQVVLDDKILSSVLVLTANRGGYYHSAGTSPEGMDCGASHFLVYQIAETLRNRSMESFNLGGTDQVNSGLERFKAGFGTTTVQLESAKFFLGGKIRKKLGTFAQILRDNPVQLFQHVLRR